MGNFCGPRRINFVKPKTFASYACNNFDKELFNVWKRNSCNSEKKSANYTSPPIKDIIFESDKSHSKFFSTNGKFVPRSGSRDLTKELDDNGNDYNEDNFSELSTSSIENNANSSSIQGEMNSSDNAKQDFEKRFKEICLEIPNQDPINIEKVTSLLEDATRSSLVSLIDLKNTEGNTAVSKAILRNDVKLLYALLKFMPDFPEYVEFENMKIPLAQLAAQQNPVLNSDENILSIILKRWIDDSYYCNVASRNIVTLNSESQDLYKFIIDLKRKKYYKSTQYTNLILLFKLFLKLFPESVAIQEKYPNIYYLCQNQHISNKIETCQNKENWLELENILQIDANQ